MESEQQNILAVTEASKLVDHRVDSSGIPALPPGIPGFEQAFQIVECLRLFERTLLIVVAVTH